MRLFHRKPKDIRTALPIEVSAGCNSKGYLNESHHEHREIFYLKELCGELTRYVEITCCKCYYTHAFKDADYG